jgi:hypothetical protein
VEQKREKRAKKSKKEQKREKIKNFKEGFGEPKVPWFSTCE